MALITQCEKIDAKGSGDAWEGFGFTDFMTTIGFYGCPNFRLTATVASRSEVRTGTASINRYHPRMRLLPLHHYLIGVVLGCAFLSTTDKFRQPKKVSV